MKDILHRLCEYAYMYSSGKESAPASFTPSVWQKLAVSTAEKSSEAAAQTVDKRHDYCRSVCRCLWLVQKILDHVHGSCKPALLPHHAAAKGYPVEVTIVLQNGLGECEGAQLSPGLTVDNQQPVLTLSAHLLMVCFCCTLRLTLYRCIA